MSQPPADGPPAPQSAGPTPPLPLTPATGGQPPVPPPAMVYSAAPPPMSPYAVASTVPVPPATLPQPTRPAGAKPQRQWTRWAIPIGTLILGLIVGSAGGGGGGVEDAPEYEAALAEQDELREALAAANDRADEAEGRIDEAEDRAASAEVDAADEAEDTIAAAQAELDTRAAELDARESALNDREAAVTSAEAAFDANNLNPGSYLVGTDIQPGMYRTVNSVSGLCYVGQNNGNDIMWNDIADAGQMIATVEDAPGSVFEFNSDCGVMQRIG